MIETLAPTGRRSVAQESVVEATPSSIPPRQWRTLITLDPGIRLAGVGVFVNTRLAAANVVKNPTKTGNGVDACVSMGQEVATWARVTLYRLIHERAKVGHETTAVDEFLAEWPQVYTAGKGKGDPNDLPPLAGVGCAVGACLRPTALLHVLPAVWKGQVPGDAFTARILGRLEPNEIEVLAKALLREDPILLTDRIDKLLKHSTAHNAIDAVGIGLYHLGRLDRRRVIPR